jgi:hypothetical protein
MRPLAVAVMLTLLAGCMSPPPTALDVHGSTPWSFEGYDYTARTLERGDGVAAIEVDAAADGGRASFEYVRDGHAWRVTMDRFAATEPWQDGGVRADFNFRGATGIGDGQLPLMHAVAAGWGAASVTMDGQAVVEPVTGNRTFDASFVVTDTAPRNATNGRVLRTGQGIFHPQHPEQGRTEPRWQVLLDLRSPPPWPPADARQAVSFQLNDPLHRNALPFEVAGSPTEVNVSWIVVRPPDTAPAAILDFSLEGPSGEGLATWHYDPRDAIGATSPPRYDVVLPAPVPNGTYVSRVEGRGAGAEYILVSLVDYPQPLFHHVAYMNVTVGG